MDPITEQLSQLMELSDDQLAELESTVLNEFETNENTELSTAVIERLESLATAVESVRSEQSRRVTERETFAAKAAEAAARVHGADKKPEGDAVAQPGDVPVEQEPVPEAVTAPEQPVAVASQEDQLAGKKMPLADPSAPPAPSAPASSDPLLDDPAGPTQMPVADEQDTPLPMPEDTPAPIVEDPNIIPGEVDDKHKIPTKPLPSKLAANPFPPKKKEDPADAEGTPAEEDGETPAEEDDEKKKGMPFSASDSENTNNTNPEAPVTASAQGSEGSLVIEPPADRRPKTSKNASTTLSITAGADIPSVSAGSNLNDMGAVAEAFVKRLHTLRHVNGGDGEQHIVASLNYAYPEDRQLTGGDAQANQDLIERVAGQNIVAAAGICLPLETDYDMHCDVGVTDRPVRDALARFAADRGGIRYYTSPVLTDFTNATGYWSRASGSGISATFHTYGPDGTTPTNPADAKPCLEVSCPAEQTAYIGAITLCLTFNNLTGRVFPELVKRQNELALVQHARIAENNLLRQIFAGSTAVTLVAGADLQLGAAREIFRLLARAVAAYRFQHRMTSSSPLRMLIGSWVKELIKADIAMQMPGDGLDNTLGLADSKVDSWFRNAGVNVTWFLDGVGTTVSSSNFDFPTTVEFALFVEGTWLYLDGGTLDLGIIRDSSLVATNQYKQFVETFEGVVNLGCGSYHVTAPLQACGSAAALVETCAAA